MLDTRGRVVYTCCCNGNRTTTARRLLLVPAIGFPLQPAGGACTDSAPSSLPFSFLSARYATGGASRAAHKLPRGRTAHPAGHRGGSVSTSEPQGRGRTLHTQRANSQNPGSERTTLDLVPACARHRWGSAAGLRAVAYRLPVLDTRPGKEGTFDKRRAGMANGILPVDARPGSARHHRPLELADDSEPTGDCVMSQAKAVNWNAGALPATGRGSGSPASGTSAKTTNLLGVCR